MGSVFLVNYLDFCRSFENAPERATPQSIAAWLKRNWVPRRGGGSWNYDPAMGVLAPAHAGQMTLNQAIAHCHAYWHPHGRIENELVVKCIWQFTQDNPSKVYGRKYLAAPVGRWHGRNIFIGIKAPLIRVSGDEVLAVMPVFRKNFIPSDVEMNLALTTVREFCLREGYRDINTELLRAVGQKGTVERRLVVDRGSARALFTSDQFDTFLETYAGGVALVADAGLGLQNPNFAGYRVLDPDQPPFPGI